MNNPANIKPQNNPPQNIKPQNEATIKRALANAQAKINQQTTLINLQGNMIERLEGTFDPGNFQNNPENTKKPNGNQGSSSKEPNKGNEKLESFEASVSGGPGAEHKEQPESKKNNKPKKKNTEEEKVTPKKVPSNPNNNESTSNNNAESNVTTKTATTTPRLRNNNSSRQGTNNNSSRQGANNNSSRQGTNNNSLRQGANNNSSRQGANNTQTRQGFINNNETPGMEEGTEMQKLSQSPSSLSEENQPEAEMEIQPMQETAAQEEAAAMEGGAKLRIFYFPQQGNFRQKKVKTTKPKKAAELIFEYLRKDHRLGKKTVKFYLEDRVKNRKYAYVGKVMNGNVLIRSI